MGVVWAMQGRYKMPEGNLAPKQTLAVCCSRHEGQACNKKSNTPSLLLPQVWCARHTRLWALLWYGAALCTASGAWARTCRAYRRQHREYSACSRCAGVGGSWAGRGLGWAGTGASLSLCSSSCGAGAAVKGAFDVDVWKVCSRCEHWPVPHQSRRLAHNLCHSVLSSMLD